jgi:hypothetical protein
MEKKKGTQNKTKNYDLFGASQKLVKTEGVNESKGEMSVFQHGRKERRK